MTSKQRTARSFETRNSTRALIRGAEHALQRLTTCVAAVFLAGTVAAQDPSHPLKPEDRSSPRATLRTFLEAGDAVGAFLVEEYMPSPSHAEFQELLAMGASLVECLDLSGVPPAARLKAGRAAAGALYETLNRLQLPPFAEIPDAQAWHQVSATNAVRWVVPHTEIAFERVESGPRRGKYLFSVDTVARAGEYYERVKGMPYARQVPLEHMKEITALGGGWMIPHTWIHALPGWLRAPWAGQAGWKWISLILVMGVFALLLRSAYRLSHRGNPQHPFLQALAQLCLPAFFLLATPGVAYVALVQINLIGNVGSAIELLASAVMFLASAWICWRVAPVIAEAIIASPKIAPESIDAHLIRICTRLFGIIAGASFLAMGADRLGLPVYGIIAGLGVGGLAIALAAQPTIENLIGGLSLFADKPVRVGDFCQYGDDKGTIEAIGIRSTRIRGVDRTLTTIPNAMLSKMPVVNLSRRDRMLIQCVIGIRYETRPEQLRHLLGGIRELLQGHPRVLSDPLRVRLVGFGASSLDVEIFAYVSTRDWAEFLGLREELFLQIMDLVVESGTGFAFPSRTLYFGRDEGSDAERTETVEAETTSPNARKPG
ncbi:MAG: mechanosensitive ion channel family protein [Verrucomicrobia bacterium]|nr:mechanosensitive ion channel family protein [Verrucomicrobiota bacterium]